MKRFILFILFLLPLTALYAQFFENFNYGIPNTWTVLNPNGGQEWERTPVGWGANGGISIFKDFQTHNDYLITPQFSVVSGVSDRISFHVRSLGLAQRFDVKLSTMGKDPADFTVTLGNETEPKAEFNNYSMYEYDLSAYDGESVYIAIIAVDSGDAILYLDEFSNDSFSCQSPFALEGSPRSFTEVFVTWRNVTGQDDWSLQYGVHDFTLGSGTTIMATNTGGVGSASISGLMEGVTYDYYVRANCGSSQSQWAGPLTIKQLESGENVAFPIDLELSTNSCNDSTTLTFNPNDAFRFYAFPGNTVAYMFFNCSSSGSLRKTGLWTRFTSPPNGVVKITTDYHEDNFVIHSLSCNSQDTCFMDEEVFCYSYFNDTTPQFVLNLEPNKEYSLAVWRNGFIPSDAPISNICVEPVDCVYPIDLNAEAISETDAKISWSLHDESQTLWEYVVQPKDGGIPSGSGISTNSTSVTVSNSANEEFEFYVRAYCGGGVYSDWNGPFEWLQTIIPANNDCKDAELLVPNSTGDCEFSSSGNTLGATFMEDDFNNCGRDDEGVWYKFVATSETYDFEVIPTNPDFKDTNYTVVLYESNLDCNDPNNWEVIHCIYNDSDKNYIIYNLTVGNLYYLRVGLNRSSWDIGKDSSFDVCVNIPPPPPSNNACIDALPIEIGMSYSGNTEWAHDVDDVPRCVDKDNNDDRSVWFKYTGTGVEQEITLGFCNRPFGQRVAIFSGDCENLICYVNSNTTDLLAQPGCDSGWNVQRKFVSDGTSTYYIFIKGSDEDEYGDFEFSVSGESLSVEDQLLKKISVYPNPVDTNFIIKNGSNINLKSIEIFDINGRSFQKIMLNHRRSETSISFQNYTSGIYFIRINSEEGSAVKKIVK